MDKRTGKENRAIYMKQRGKVVPKYRPPDTQATGEKIQKKRTGISKEILLPSPL
jgi:hypothetical protein